MTSCCKITADLVLFTQPFVVQKLFCTLAYPYCLSQMLLYFFCIVTERVEDQSYRQYSRYGFTMILHYDLMMFSLALYQFCSLYNDNNT